MFSALSPFELLLERGGIVMVPLLAISVASLAMILERSVFWIVQHRRSRRSHLEAFHDRLRRGRRPELLRQLASDRTPHGKVARRLLERGSDDGVALEAVEFVRPGLERFMVSLSTIITAAPLLGILGTVLGIIRSFGLLGSDSAMLGDPRAVAGGIGEALLTTAFGLVVALCTLFPYMAFRTQVVRTLATLEVTIAAVRAGETSVPRPQSGPE